MESGQGRAVLRWRVDGDLLWYNTLNEIMFFWPNLGQAWKGGNISHLQLTYT